MEQLQEIAINMSGFINEPEVKSEIISYATERTGGEVFRPFGAILTPEFANSRISSAFAKSFTNSITSCSTCRSETNDNLDSLLSILTEHYAVYAPYLAEDFSDSEEPITISWWDGIDTTGITPGILSTDTQNGRVSGGFIQVNDDYASAHPTLVIRPIEDDVYLEDYCAIGAPCDIIGSGNSGGGYTSQPRDIDCREIPTDATLEVQMPQFQLNGNTRGWPADNRLTMHIVRGDYTIKPDGSIVGSPNNLTIFSERSVSRRDARKRNWVSTNSSYILGDWKQSQIEMRVIVMYKQGGKTVTTSGKVKIDSDGNFTNDLTADYTISEGKAKMMFNIAMDRCATLGSITSDSGFGKREGYRIWRWDKFAFYLIPVIRN